jgi:hypothetical protein
MKVCIETMNDRRSEPKYILRFLFDAGSGICFWAGNEASKARFGYPILAEDLPISRQTQNALNEIIQLYDESFNWKSPTDPGTWTPVQRKEFDKKVVQTIKTAIEELGPDFRVLDEVSPRMM